MHYIFRALLSLTLFMMALLSWHCEVLGNSASLGRDPSASTFLSISFLSIPLVVASVCAFTIQLSKLPWGLLGLSALGLAMRIALSENLLLLLAYPYCFIVNWMLGIKMGALARSFWCIALFFIAMPLATFFTAEFARAMETKATLKSKQFCALTKTGDSIKSLRERAQYEVENRGHLKWTQVFDSIEGEDGKLSVLYRGYNLSYIRTCKIEVRNGKVFSEPIWTDER